MSGNVEEWCVDWFGDYNSSSQKDYSGPRTGEKRVVRGGSFYNSESVCRVYNRQKQFPSHKSPFIGFRLVREI